MDQTECLSLATLLESRGVLELKRAKDSRLTKVWAQPWGQPWGQPWHAVPMALSTALPLQVSLKVEEEEAQHALQDATLVGSILARGLF